MKFIKMFEDFHVGSIKSVNDLIIKLNQYDIPIETWATGQAKDVESLYKEIIGEECIIEDMGGFLVRMIEFVGIRILYKDKSGVTWLLVEDRQEFKDGRIRRRKMPSSVSEKMKFGEDPLNSAIRGIKEELGVEVRPDQLKKFRPLYYDGGSQSYPGLRAKYKGHQYTCYFDDTQFEMGGYVEIQSDKSTFFKWIKRD
jgi:hypothetical protein